MPAVTVTDVSKHFSARGAGPVAALRGISFDLREKALTVLAGPSGSGKTTLLRLIAGLDKPDEGKIEIEGKAPGAAQTQEPQAAMVFQEPALYSHLSVRQNLLFPLLIRKAPKKTMDDKAKELADLLKLEGLLDRDPETLSGGQKQRVALGRALASNSKLLLLDEPFSNLDPGGRSELRQELITIQRALGLTVIYVTHDQAEALAMADQICVLNNGKMEQHGSPLEIYNRPASMFVALFFGHPALNVLDGELMREEGALSLEIHFANSAIPLSPAEGLQLPDYLPSRLPVKVGIRPENISLDPDGQISAQLKSLLFQGDRWFAEWDSDLGPLRSYVYQPLQPGARALPYKLAIQGSTHLFDATTGQRMASFRHEPC